MDGINIRVDGLKEVTDMLTKASRIVAANAMLNALSAAGNVIADAVAARTPVKPEDVGGLLDKGELRESVMVAVEMDSKIRGGTVYVGFGKNGFIAMWVENGHRLLGHKPAKKVIGQVIARPFIRPAFASSKEAAVDKFIEVLQAELQNEIPFYQRSAA